MKGLVKQINITLLLVLAIGVALFFVFRPSVAAPSDSRVHTIDEAKIKGISRMVSLCTLEMYEETGINDTINGKGLFAIQRLRGSISFDAEHMRIDSIGRDSLRVYLPAEKIRWLESTDSGSYRVVDIWNEKMPILKANLSTAEENELKRRATARASQLAVSKGYVQRARKSAVHSLEQMFSPFTDIYIEVVDTAAVAN